MLVSDNVSFFTSYEFRECFKKTGIKFTLILPYHSESNSAADTSDQEVKKTLTCQILDEDYDKIFTGLQHELDSFQCRNTPSTVTGITLAVFS